MYQPNYSKCTDERREVHHNICKHMKKQTYMLCMIMNKKCIAWEGYKHEEAIKEEVKDR